ncbi:uncharacterized protein LOC142227488 [Haematobia irritans]|uniref:uncharacterized protein LOC142227488 n=1 Tax=Haematobia irritans TaxID=7368 RepID=UPI003F4FA139
MLICCKQPFVTRFISRIKNPTCGEPFTHRQKGNLETHLLICPLKQILEFIRIKSCQRRTSLQHHIVRRCMDLSQHVLKVTYSKRLMECDHSISIIRLENCKTLITVYTKEIIQRLSKHRVISVARIKDGQGHKNLLQLEGDLYISCRTYISDEVFNKINRQQNFWFGRNAANRLMLFEHPDPIFHTEERRDYHSPPPVMTSNDEDEIPLSGDLNSLNLEESAAA